MLLSAAAGVWQEHANIESGAHGYVEALNDLEANAVGLGCAGPETLLPFAGWIGQMFRQSRTECCECEGKKRGGANGW